MTKLHRAAEAAFLWVIGFVLSLPLLGAAAVLGAIYGPFPGAPAFIKLLPFVLLGQLALGALTFWLLCSWASVHAARHGRPGDTKAAGLAVVRLFGRLGIVDDHEEYRGGDGE